jgi:TrmH family RNA methyltransferase
MTNPPKIITSTANPVVKMLKSLSTRKYREEEGLFLVEGARHVADAVAGGFTLSILAHADHTTPDAALTASAAQTLIVTDEILSRITNRDNAQAIIGAFALPRHELTRATDDLWIGLEGVRDPGNLGTIIRTADAAGAAGIILIGDCCDPYQPETIRATMGSFARIPVIRVSTANFLSWRATWRGRVIGTHLNAASIDYREARYPQSLLLLMGSESAGLSPDITAACDTLVKIPMAGGTESLNLAVSTGIMLYEIRRESL